MTRTHSPGIALLVAGIALLMAACASTGTAVKAPAASGPLRTAGNRCQGGTCTCRPVDNQGRSLDPNFDEGAPAPGTKRYEIRTGRGTDPATVTVEGLGSFSKSTTSPEPTCVYVDLPPGKHRISVHAIAANPELGQEPAVFVREYSPEKQSWYDTFQWRCGGGEDVCSIGHMEQFLAEARKVERGIFDPCGSTRVENIGWEAGRSVGAARLAELTVNFALTIYKFTPRFAHGAPTCKGLSPAGE